MALSTNLQGTYGKIYDSLSGVCVLICILPALSVQINNIGTPDLTISNDMFGCITWKRTETILSFAWSLHNDRKEGTEDEDAESGLEICNWWPGGLR